MTQDPISAGLNWYTYCEGNPIMFYDPTGLDSWVIYAICDDDKENEGQRRAAKIRATEYEEKYGTPCYIFGVSSAWEFKYIWNNMVGYVFAGGSGERYERYQNYCSWAVNIDAVEVIAHGSTQLKNEKADDYLIGYIFFQDGSKIYAQENSKTGAGSGNYSVTDLKKKSMDSLYFGACNTANKDFKVNIATGFFNYMTGIKNVTGWDGGVVYVETDRVGAIPLPWFRGWTGKKVTVNEYRSSPSQDTFNKLTKKFNTHRNKGSITLTR